MNATHIQNKIETGDIVVPIKDALDPNRKKAESFPCGFPILDEATAKKGKKGFKDGDLIVISGKSGNGKTMLALNFIKNFLDLGITSILFSYEVIIDNVYETFEEMGVEDNPAIFTPKKNVTGDVDWIKDKVKEADRKYWSKVVVIDHLDFVTAKGITSDDHRRNEINNIVRELKNFAVENHKIVILLAHIIKTDKQQLQNEDIADSRSINNLADYIMFIGRKVDESGNQEGNEGIIRLTKNRYTGIHDTMTFFVNNSLIQPYVR